MKKLTALLLVFVMLAVTSASAFAASAKVPSAPQVKAASVSYQSITLTWNKVKNASGYIIYRSTKSDSGFKTIKTIKSSKTVSYTDKSLATGKVYYYRVKAYNSAGKSSYETVSAIPSLSKPVITVEQVTSKCNRVTLKRKIDGASYYEIYIANARNKVYRLIGTFKSSRILMHDQISNMVYYYKVRACRIVNGRKVYSAFSKVKSCLVI